MKKLILLLIAVMVFLPETKATHLMGGEIRYEQIGNNAYLIHLILYRDESGAALPAVQGITIQHSNTTVNGQLNRLWIDKITNGCWKNGIERHIYTGTVTINDDNFTIRYEDCCRNTQITNLPSPGMQSLWISTKRFDNPGLSGVVNSSPVINTFSTFVVPAGVSREINFGASDPDGDSLVYSLGYPQGANGAPIYYGTSSGPINGSFLIDSSTGKVTVNGAVAQVAVIRIDIDEYRNTPQGAVKIGSTFRDVQIHFVNQPNNLPVMSGINNSQHYSLQVLAGDTALFQVFATDADAGDTLQWLWQPDIPDASISVTTGARPVLTFEWITDSTDVQFAPHHQQLRVQDNNCNAPGEAVRTFSIIVLPDTSELVWPGDTDNDLVANVLDILPIGLAYGAQGPVRANATTAWTGQASTPWNTTFWNGLDYKFADADGNGTIDSADADVVYLNYGQTHQKVGAMTGDDIRVYIDGGEVLPGTEAALVIEAPQPISDFYGLAMEVNLPSGLIATSNLQWDNSNSFLGSDLLQSAELINGGAQLALAITGTDQQNRSGSGELARLIFEAGTSLTPGDSLSFSFSQFKAIDAQGADKNYGVAASGCIVADINTAVDNPNPLFSLWPNPTQGSFFVQTETTLEQVAVVDLAGRIVFSGSIGADRQVHLPAHVAPGFYMVEVSDTNGKKMVQQLVVQ